ncbi:MAG TPA: hypothetical protein PLV68_03925 [Ilumatobacteraceae bacterium]|nr:hypothetical protein [Ilumatobacteraceae bacterium]
MASFVVAERGETPGGCDEETATWWRTAFAEHRRRSRGDTVAVGAGGRQI